MIHIKTTIIQPIEISTQTLIKLFDTKINIENFKKDENAEYANLKKLKTLKQPAGNKIWMNFLIYIVHL